MNKAKKIVDNVLKKNPMNKFHPHGDLLNKLIKKEPNWESSESPVNRDKGGSVCGYCGWKKCRCKYDENGNLKGE
jgi:hypothetical protein